MADTTLLAKEPEAGQSTTFTEFNVRQDKGRQHFIRLHDSVVKALERQLAAASGEAFGILLGTVDSEESCTIAVEQFATAASIEESIRSRNGERVIGYYRTHPRADFSLESPDLALFQRCFATGPRLALLVKPQKADVGTAMFFLGEDGQLDASRATVEFPFNLRELGAEEPAAAPVPVPTPVVKPQTAMVEPERRGSLWKIALAWTVAIGSVVGLYGFRVFDRQPTAPAVVEKPATVQQPPAPELPAVSQIEPPAPMPAPKPAAAAAPRSKPPVVAPIPTNPAPVLELRREPHPLAPAVQSQPPVAWPVAEPRPALTTPPPVREQVVAPTPPVSTTPATRPPEPVMPFTAPRAIRQFAPVVKDDVRRSITVETVIRLRVHVDGTGKVIGADPLNATGPVASALAGAAITAVKRWAFEPARRGEDRVPGEVELSFTFRK
jgi:TonB family protein